MNRSRNFVHHTLHAINSGTAVTLLVYEMDDLITGAANTANPGFPSAVRLNRVFNFAGCLVVNTAGNWTVRLRVNESGSDSFTFSSTIPVVSTPEKAVTEGNGLILDPGDSYHMLADGPSRNFALSRLVLEWEIL